MNEQWNANDIRPSDFRRPLFVGASARAPSRRGNAAATPQGSTPPVGGRRGRPAPVLTCAPGETAAAAAKYVCRCSALRSGRFRYYGPCVARQGRLHGPPPRPHARRPPCAPSPGAVTENVMCGRVGRRSGGRSAHPQRTARHTRSPAKQSVLRRVQPVTTRVCSGRRAPAARHGETTSSDNAGFAVPTLPRPSGRSRQSPV